MWLQLRIGVSREEPREGKGPGPCSRAWVPPGELWLCSNKMGALQRVLGLA